MRAVRRAADRPGSVRHEQPAAAAERAARSDGEFPIGRLAREAGVSSRTIRYYEEIGLLKTARRYAGGRRVFQQDALERLRFIARLKRLGFTLGEISELSEVFELNRSTAAMLTVLDGKLGQHEAAIDEQIRELSRLREDLTAYRRHIGRRLQGLRMGKRAAAPP